MSDNFSPVSRNLQRLRTARPEIRSDISMIAVRVASGVRSHFHIRATEWVMLFPTICLGIALLYQDNMFAKSQAFRVLDSWFTGAQWALLILVCALLRTIALVVNGTFQGFGVSPHLRLIASLAGAAFWSQFGLGFVISASLNEATWLVPILISTFCMMEVLNITRSCSDVFARRR